jgi:GDP-L-fucose synthase
VVREGMICVTGGRGFLGRYVVEELERRGQRVVVPQGDLLKDELNLEGVSAVIHLAARVGGIGYNLENPVRLLEDNLRLGMNVLDACHRWKVGKVVLAGTVCMYPRVPPRIPFVEDDLWCGYPESSNAPYGLAKRLVLELGRAYRRQHGMNVVAVVPTNLYGVGDCYDSSRSHVIPALVRKFCGTDPVTVWGDGSATREFLYVYDAAVAVCDVLDGYDGEAPLNLGGGEEVSIRTLAETVAAVSGYAGAWEFDASRPSGQPRRALDCSRARSAIGFSPKVSLHEGLVETINAYRNG